MEKFQQASISEKLDTDRISNVSLVQPPSVGRKPVKPKKALNIGLGLVLGLFGGVALGFAWDYFDDAIKTREDVEKLLEIPVLLSVSREEFKTCI
jgi:capsular polysaccharide biosynthesis protein